MRILAISWILFMIHFQHCICAQGNWSTRAMRGNWTTRARKNWTTRVTKPWTGKGNWTKKVTKVNIATKGDSKATKPTKEGGDYSEFITMKDTKLIRFLPPINTTFHELPQYSTFIDKSLMIRDFFGTFPIGSLILFTAPRGFAKTTNLDMLRYFVELEMDKFGNRITKKGKLRNFPLFAKQLKISIYRNIIKEHMGEYPVIYMDLNHVIGDTFEETLVALRKALRITFQPYEWLRKLIKSNHTSDPEKYSAAQKYELFIMEKVLDGEPTRVEIPEAMYLLSRTLHRYFGQKVFVFVDGYDSPMVDAITKRDLNYEDAFYLIETDMLGQIFKKEYMSYHVMYGFITGVTNVAHVDRINVLQQPFRGEHAFTPYYGFTENEVIELLRRHEISETHLKEIKKLYTNYNSTADYDKVIQLYNPYVVINYIKDKNQTTTNVMEYWSNDLFLHDLPNFLKSNSFRKYMTTLLFNGQCEMLNKWPITTYEMWTLWKVVGFNYVNISEYEIACAFKHFHDHGYTLTDGLNTWEPYVVIVVDEIKEIFVQQVEKFYIHAGLDLPAIGENLIAMLHNAEISKDELAKWNTSLHDWFHQWHISWDYEFHSYYRKYGNVSYLDGNSMFEIQAIIYCSLQFWFRHEEIGGYVQVVPTLYNQSTADLVAMNRDRSAVMVVRTTYKKNTKKALNQAKHHRLNLPKEPQFIKYMGINVWPNFTFEIEMV